MRSQTLPPFFLNQCARWRMMRNWLLSTVLIRKCDRKWENQWWEISLLIRWCVLGPRSANKTVVPQRDVRPDCDYSFECVVDRVTFLICSNWKKNKMPKSNHLPFLRPLYDIAVWQFILMIGAQGDTKFTYKMHMVVANFVCKLLETRPFSHLKDKMITEEVKLLTDNWMPGERERPLNLWSGARTSGEEKNRPSPTRISPTQWTSRQPCLGSMTRQFASIAVYLAQNVELTSIWTFQKKCLRFVPFVTTTKSTRWMSQMMLMILQTMTSPRHDSHLYQNQHLQEWFLDLHTTITK